MKELFPQEELIRKYLRKLASAEAQDRLSGSSSKLRQSGNNHSLKASSRSGSLQTGEICWLLGLSEKGVT